jgi:predicted O-methyltransferase YrrM
VSAEHRATPAPIGRAKALRNRMLRRVLEAGQRVGVDITPHHFYSNVPDLRSLAGDPSWRAPRSMHGVRGADVDEQVQFLADLFTEPVRDVLRARDVYREACTANGAVGYGPVETQVLFAFVAARRPERIVQVGSGVSTAVALAAARAFGVDVEITCIDPFPTEYLRARERAGEIRLLDVPAQQVPMEEFTKLGEGDLLFVDSTHTVKPGSEVNRLILDVFPQLNRGVFVHVHDVYFPYDYGRDVLSSELFFWNESVLLHAFLINNDRAAIAASCSMLHHARSAELARLVPRYTPQPMTDGLARDGVVAGDFPSATYLRVTG